MSESLEKLASLTKDMCKVLDIDITTAVTVDDKLSKATNLIREAQDSLQVATAVSAAKDEAATALSTSNDEAATAVSTAKDVAATAVSTAKDVAATAVSKANDAAVGEAKDAQIAQLTADLKTAVDKNDPQ